MELKHIDTFDGTVDPYEMAARYKHRSVNIHPFVDGNDRVCRLIMNTILLRYVGHLCIFGSTNDEVHTYLGIAYRRGRKSEEEEGEVPEREQIGQHELARFVLRISVPFLLEMA